MAFSSPTFNLPVNIWHYPNNPPAVPDVATIGNLAIGRRISWNGVSSSAPEPYDRVWLLLPAGTDIRDPLNTGSVGDRVEVGAGTQRFYDVGWVEDAGGGFANEHRVALLRKYAGWPYPYPRPTLGLPVTLPKLVGSGVSSDGGGFVSITFSAPPGIICASVAMTNLVSNQLHATVSTSGIPPQHYGLSAPGVVLTRMTLYGHSWPHPGGIATYTAGTSTPSTILAALFAMGGNTFDQFGQNTLSGVSPMTVSSAATGFSPDTALAAFLWDNGTLPGTWSLPFLAVPGLPLSQTFGGLGPMVMDCGVALGLLPGVQTANESLVVPSSGSWVGGITAIGP